MSSRYTAEIDLVHPNDPHTMAIARVPAGSDVLDLGAADGSVAAALARMGCRVWGVELDEKAAAAARQTCEGVVVGDLDSLDLESELGSRRFRVVLCLDVLEHLKDPVAALRQAAALLQPGGWVVVSLPNVAHADVRLQLLGGRFAYTESGLLDRTHLRFFDRQGVEELFESAGLAIIDLDRVVQPVGGTEIRADAGDPIVAERLRADPEAETYQFVVMAAPVGSPVVSDPPVLMARDLQRRVRDLVLNDGQRAWWEANIAYLRDSSRHRENVARTLLEELRIGVDQVAAGWPGGRDVPLPRTGGLAGPTPPATPPRSSGAKSTGGGQGDVYPKLAGSAGGLGELYPGAAGLYMDLLIRSLTRFGYGEPPRRASLPADLPPEVTAQVSASLANAGLAVYAPVETDPEERRVGLDWPVEAESMIGLARLENLATCVAQVVRDGVPGDLIETGVWRGGASILMRAALAALGDPDRKVWVADSFAGLPPPDEDRYPADAGDDHWTYDVLSVSADDVRANFAKYGMLDDRVRFLVGWFADTLPSAPIDQLSVLRLDGDMYGSTIEALEALYPKLSPGGFCIVDDYGAVAGCRQAVTDYREAHGIDEPITWVDWTGAWWRRSF